MNALPPGRIAIRADGGGRIGLGHVMRCAALAAALDRTGHRALFITATPEILPAGLEGAADIRILDEAETAARLTGYLLRSDVSLLVGDWQHVDPALVAAVRAAGIKVEVTPGISAALACAASTQIPLTHRDDAQAVTFVTGQPKAGGPELDYEALAAATHTVVIYMGVRTAAATAQRLIEAGRDAATPVAVIENGSRPDERSFIATLATLAETVERARLTGPAIIVIGDVVRRAPEQVPALARELKERQAA